MSGGQMSGGLMSGGLMPGGLMSGGRMTGGRLSGGLKFYGPSRLRRTQISYIVERYLACLLAYCSGSVKYHLLAAAYTGALYRQVARSSRSVYTHTLDAFLLCSCLANWPLVCRIIYLDQECVIDFAVPLHIHQTMSDAGLQNVLRRK